jgi:hypothetical protein
LHVAENAPPIDCDSLITLELDQVFQSVVIHAAVQDSLDLILLLTVNESCGWGRHRSSAKDRIRRHRGQLDHWEDRVKAAEMVREFKAVCAMADASFDDKGA